ncbi:NirD/YgiW/YdeI family stress tolerance protein [Vibrio sp. Vb2110]|uniref:YgiW/YdeI family stress tolerance OB fold protein n=1 Tax=unclassified Vibrio TaxID=2614977 RepID=UPI00280820D8|nr:MULTISPECIES: NirD/YgiW/YdeI family stress tolerance protein [unclassified Vibrio]ELA9196547.1 YgiW/YdeI family stress tolerance OB fold protein [Vibrio parahaemolyticus]MDG3414612.1 NirD/YgiW/YdeI family stress tolerance protein [Vibrio parahaemolyticus]MDW1848685.1 NirD/YgiW/YdeI family stress tolerance protein [Vibrio sp. Vb2130]MDW1882800.1 NirD/YgiW/YdeI family stress tolerance protein [Vibrio sp. Vb2110]MDW2040858.1 NirD/YgiW/YdeI family stress tolerance protein [Vibrio sp. 2130-1]
MKHFIFTSILMLSTGAIAQGFYTDSAQPKPGFSGPVEGISTAEQVLNAGMFSDDMPVTLTGNITSSLGGEMYVFEDSSGKVTVEIDHDKWLGQSATPDTKVQLIGEIDKNISGVKVDVDALKVL